MLELKQSTLRNIVVHNVGNKSKGENLSFSKSEFNMVDENINNILLQYFLSPFKTDEFYNFFHESDINLNEVYNYVSKIFADKTELYNQSKNISKHLFEQSTHPKIKGGEFYIAYLEDCVVDGELVDGIGLFKSENKDTYIRVYQQGDNFEIDYENGININKLDKGCLIFNTEKEQGYKISIVDTYNKGNEAVYWREDFLKIKPREDNYYSTSNFIDMCKSFSETVLTEDNNVDKKEQIEFIKRTQDFFKDNEEYKEESFHKEVINEPVIVDAFKEFKTDFEEASGSKTGKEFDISENAVKKSQKFFKSVIKLDKNFHIYVHSRPNNMEKGFDESKQKKFYKLFYNDEA